MRTTATLLLTLVTLLFFLPALALPGEEGAPRKAFKLTPVKASEVTFQDEFWAPRIAIMREDGIIHQHRMLLDTGRKNKENVNKRSKRIVLAFVFTIIFPPPIAASWNLISCV